MKRTALHCTVPSLLVCLAATAGCARTSIHSPETDWLARTLTAREMALSDAYSTCSLHRLHADLLAGTRIWLPDGRRVEAMTEAREQICGRQRREVVPESLIVRSASGDSAVVFGEQRFCAIDVNPCIGSSSRFVTLWTMHEGTWRVVRMQRFASKPGPSQSDFR